MEVRVYNDNDKEEVIALWKECGLVAVQNDPAKDIERKLKVDPDLFLVGTKNGEHILKIVESRIQEKGCPKINLQVRNTNTSVIEFYKAIGYADDNVTGLGKRLVCD